MVLIHFANDNHNRGASRLSIYARDLLVAQSGARLQIIISDRPIRIFNTPMLRRMTPNIAYWNGNSSSTEHLVIRGAALQKMIGTIKGSSTFEAENASRIDEFQAAAWQVLS